jgi:predicted TIM-barrel fold metal-dependent hydrolase
VRHLRHVLGTENLMWSSDYPHPVSTWPKSLAVIDEQLGDLPRRDRELMVWGNAARVWNL